MDAEEFTSFLSQASYISFFTSRLCQFYAAVVIIETPSFWFYKFFRAVLTILVYMI